MKLYHTGDTYVIVTNKSPKGMGGMLFVAQTGDTPSTLKETVVAKAHIDKWKEVKEPSNEWREALGLPLALPLVASEPVERRVEIIYVEKCAKCERDELRGVLGFITAVVLTVAAVACVSISPVATLIFLFVLGITCKERLKQYVS